MHIFQVDLSELQEMSRSLSERQMNRVDRAISRATVKATTLIWQTWCEEIRRAPGVWVGDKERYAGSLRMDVRQQGPVHWMGEVWTDLKLAEEIDHGRPPRDLKKYLTTSNKARTSASGSRYLVIPFRHNTPGNRVWGPAMPKQVYLQARKLDQATVPAIPGRHVARLPAGLAPKLQPHHATDPFAGMVRMNANSPKARSSTYLTFRTMSEHSPGWVIPAKAGLELARKVEDSVRHDVEYIIYQAVRRALPKALCDNFRL